MAELGGRGIPDSRIMVYGMLGKFSLGKDDDTEQRYVIKYFNTVASKHDSDEAGQTKKLLEKLKPMREIVKATDLNDLSSLLQRDLNDTRVAHELVPYLRGERSEIGFFPGILVALMPKKFLENKEGMIYPSPEKHSELVTKYADFWDIERYTINNKLTSLSTLIINPENTDLIVLDGQHRANAFRYMAGTFDAALDTYNIYHAFYQSCTPSPLFDAELPVTIIWFESKQGNIMPAVISRKLFVDVNMYARTVNKSRQILLDDTTIPRIVTSRLYSRFAEQGFSADNLSLLHSGFDGDYVHGLVLFNPTMIHYAQQFFIMGRDKYNKLSTKIDRESADQQTNLNRFRRFVPDLVDDKLKRGLEGNYDCLEYVNKIVREKLTDRFYELLNTFVINREFFQVTKKLETYIEKEALSGEREVWEKVFCGGEGLYSNFKDLPKSRPKSKPKSKRSTDRDRAEQYIEIINTIEEKFYKLFSETVDIETKTLKAAFKTIKTEANYAGFFMALSVLHKNFHWDNDLIKRYIDELNKLSVQAWINIFTELKPLVIKTLEPKSWPYLRNIYLRVIQSNNTKNYKTDDRFEYFQRDPELSPDYLVLKNSMGMRLLAAINRDEPITTAQEAEQVARSAKQYSINKLEEILKLCSIEKIFSEKDLETMCDKIIEGHEEYRELIEALEEQENS